LHFDRQPKHQCGEIVALLEQVTPAELTQMATFDGFPKQRRVENRLLSERQAVVLQGKIALR
jgi:hypothetical protein